jgi:exopolysaccharide production protein ExoY
MGAMTAYDIMLVETRTAASPPAFESLPALGTVRRQLSSKRLQLRIKRAIDLVVGLACLIITLPLLALAAALIKLTSRGPVLFVQRRWGLHGRMFTCYKLRTMIVDEATHQQGDVTDTRGDGELRKAVRDPRVTRVGAVLRRTSIDELPQLLNVVLGEMSLVGPRPLVGHMLTPFPELRAVRCELRPGITGLWQVRDRANCTSVRYMARHDLEYITNYSLLLDAKILLATIRAVVTAKGAF